MASSFTNIRDHRIKMPHALDHYLLYNRMYMCNYYPVHQITSDCLIPWAVSWKQLYKVSILISLFSTKLNNLLEGWEALRMRL